VLRLSPSCLHMFQMMLMTLLKNVFVFISQATVSAFLITICKCKQHDFVRLLQTWSVYIPSPIEDDTRRRHSRTSFKTARGLSSLAPCGRFITIWNQYRGWKLFSARDEEADMIRQKAIAITWRQRKTGVRYRDNLLGCVWPFGDSKLDFTAKGR
jgi:hypothetical protein